MERALRGGVEGLAVVKGEDLVWLPLFELPLRHEQGTAGVGTGGGLLRPVADQA